MTRREENFLHLIDDRLRSLALASVDERVQFISEEQDYSLPYSNDLHETLDELLT